MKIFSLRTLTASTLVVKLFVSPKSRLRLWESLDTPIFAYYLTIQELVGKGRVGCFDKLSTNGKINHFNINSVHPEPVEGCF